MTVDFLALNGTFISTSRLREHHRRGGKREIYRTGRTVVRYCPLDMTGPCTRKFMAIVDVYTRPDQSKQHFIEDKEGTREVSSIAEKLLALNDCWGCHFSLGVRPLMGCPNSV